MNALRECQISGYGYALPKNVIKFGDQTRYRISNEETQMSLALEAINNAFIVSEMSCSDIDAIVFASSIGFQAIPCSAALIHEQLKCSPDVPAMDINTTCTSVISALDIMSYLVHAQRYKNVLIVSSEVPSLALNEAQKESYELFSDAATAIILSTATEEGQGIIGSVQKTWSHGAHWTEIRGGLSNLPPRFHNQETASEYLFDMDGQKVLRFSAENIPTMYKEFLENYHLTNEDIDLVIPHQASRALPLMMSRIGVEENHYVDWISDYGNMVSASVPFLFSKLSEDNQIKAGQQIILCGTAAGLTANILAMRL